VFSVCVIEKKTAYNSGLAILPFSFSAENPQLNHIYIFNSRSRFGNIAKPQTLCEINPEQTSLCKFQ